MRLREAKHWLGWMALGLCAVGAAGKGKKKADKDTPTLDQYLSDINKVAPPPPPSTPGSTYVTTGRLADSMRDVRAAQVYDLVTILVSDSATASNSGVTNTDRKSSAKSAINSLAGQRTGALPNLLDMTGETQLQGTGTTSRQSSFSTNITAQVVSVLPNGNLVVQGQKDIMVNSERQLVTILGIVRPDDLSPTNSIPSDRLAKLVVHVNGKGVVEDAVRRPNFLYRLLLGLLPF